MAGLEDARTKLDWANGHVQEAAGDKAADEFDGFRKRWKDEFKIIGEFLTGMEKALTATAERARLRVLAHALAHRRRADADLLGDLPVGTALGPQVEHALGVLRAELRVPSRRAPPGNRLPDVRRGAGRRLGGLRGRRVDRLLAGSVGRRLGPSHPSGGRPGGRLLRRIALGTRSALAHSLPRHVEGGAAPRGPALGVAVEHTLAGPSLAGPVPVERALVEHALVERPFLERCRVEPALVAPTRAGTAGAELRGDGVRGTALVVGRAELGPRVRRPAVHGRVDQDPGQPPAVGEVQAGDVGGAVPDGGQRLAPGGDLRAHLGGRHGAQRHGAGPAASGLGPVEPTAGRPRPVVQALRPEQVLGGEEQRVHAGGLSQRRPGRAGGEVPVADQRQVPHERGEQGHDEPEQDGADRVADVRLVPRGEHAGGGREYPGQREQSAAGPVVPGGLASQEGDGDQRQLEDAGGRVGGALVHGEDVDAELDHRQVRGPGRDEGDGYRAGEDQTAGTARRDGRDGERPVGGCHGNLSLVEDCRSRISNNSSDAQGVGEHEDIGHV